MKRYKVTRTWYVYACGTEQAIREAPKSEPHDEVESIEIKERIINEGNECS